MIVLIGILMNCQSDEYNDILPVSNFSVDVNLNIPQYIDLQVAGGWAVANGGISGIIIYNVNGSTYKAWERNCPHLTPTNCSIMTVQNNIRLFCPCDDSSFSILDGGSQTEGISLSAREYRVTDIGNNMLRISNF